MLSRQSLIRVGAGLSLGAALAYSVLAAPEPAPVTADFPSGKVQIQSAGALAFGPDGVLFVGDSVGSSIAALDTNDNTAPKGAVKIDVAGVDAKIAALAGVAPDQIMINDLKVHPISKNVYLSASRGRGPEAQPLVVRVTGSGEVSLVGLDNIKHLSIGLKDAPQSDTSARQNPRMMTITDMTYVNGNLMVAGLSNEEWSSALRSIPFPFKNTADRTTVQIWHSSHGRYETQSPVRTFVPYTIAGKQYVFAAYTCTPLVKIPVSDLKPGAKVKGVTIADLGSGNQPLDMIPYKKDGHEFILISNTSFGVVKLKADSLENYQAIDSPTVVKGSAGAPYDKMSDIKSVQQLAQLSASEAVILTGKVGNGAAVPVNIQTISLP